MLIEDKNDIKNLIAQCGIAHGVISLNDISELTLLGCNVDVGINENGDYMYQIPVKSMFGKDIPNDLITKNRWELSSDGDYIIMYMVEKI